MKLPKVKINLIHHITSKKPSLKLFLAGKFFVYAVVVIGLLIVGFSYKVIFSGEGIIPNLEKLNIVGQLRHLISDSDRRLAGEDEDRINVLLLGVGGGEHDGAQLTDTNIIVSLRPSTGEAAILSIPRDLYAPIADYGIWRKINSANAYGEADSPGKGAEVTKKTVENIFALPTHYYIRVDFSGFEKLIDEFSGVDIYVENTLDDYEYPILGKEDVFPLSDRYEHLRVEKGWQHMDGALALKYARSRHAAGAEGSDFARSRRQQKVLAAFKDKVFKITTFLSIKKITNLLNALNEHVNTNMEIWEMMRLADLAKNVDNEKIINHVLDDGPEGLLYATTTPDGAYILKPKSNTWRELRYLAENIFTAGINNPKVMQKAAPAPKILNVEIQNGTKKDGLAGKTSFLLQNMGYKITEVKNAAEQDYKKTIIYDLTNGGELEALKNIQKTLNAGISLTMPGWLTESFFGEKEQIEKNLSADEAEVNTKSNADFIIVLGENAIPLIFNEE